MTMTMTCSLDPVQQARIGDWLDEARVVADAHNEATIIDWLSSQRQVLPACVVDLLQSLGAVGGPHVLVIRGLPLENDRVPPTPSRYVPPNEYSITDADLLHGLVSLELGQPIGFKGQQNARIFNDIIPLKDHRATNNHSAGYLANFGLHTEDSFFPLPPTFFGLLCARNDGHVPSRFAPLADALRLVSPTVVELLRTTEVLVRLNAAQVLEVDGSGMPRLPIIWGPDDDPFFRINQAAPVETDEEAVGAAIDDLLKALDAVAFTVSLQRGDAVWVDNRRVAHGRDRYFAHHNGSDRWMKRLVVVPDLEPLAELMVSSRVVDNDLLATVRLSAGWGR